MKTIKTVAFYCKDKFVQLVDAYLKMKDGFVADNEKEVDKQATMMLAIINSTPDSLLAGETLNYWKEKKGFLLAHLKLYKEAEKDKDKRLNFVFLSTVVVKSVKPLGYNKPLYVDYCPMANKNKGAYYAFAVIYKNPFWVQYFTPTRILLLVVAGATGAILAEMLHLSTGSWRYSQRMPIVPVVKVGVSPVLQFMILPIFSYRISSYFTKLFGAWK